MSNYVERSRSGFGSRIKNSVGGVIFGVVLLLGGTVGIYLNESNSVRRAKELKEGRGAVVSVDSSKVDPANEGKLVHLTGETKTDGQLSDEKFGVSGGFIKINRKAEMYQWQENVSTRKENKTGGSSETVKTYSHSKSWSSGLNDSSKFKYPNGHTNPSSMPYKSQSSSAKAVSLGAFALPDFLISKINNSTDFVLDSLEGIPQEVKQSARLHAGGLYIGADPAAPAVGDMRITFSVVKPGPTSVVAMQKGSTFAKYPTKTGRTLDILHVGNHDANAMFDTEVKNNAIMTWIFRGAAFFALMVGFNLILGPLSVMASVLPFLGNLVAKGTGVISFLLAAVVWTVVVGISWLVVRPILGITILAVTIFLIVMIVRRIKQGKKEGGPPPLQEEPPSMTPPPLT